MVKKEKKAKKPKEKTETKDKSKAKKHAVVKSAAKEIISIKEKSKKISKTSKDESYFIVLLKKRDLLFASWMVDAAAWKKKIKAAEADKNKKPCLFIDVFSMENTTACKIDSLSVHSLENSWHIFVKEEYFGKRLVFNLSFHDKKNNTYDILISKEIYIPLSSENLEAIYAVPGKEKLLFELSGVNWTGVPDPGITSRQT